MKRVLWLALCGVIFCTSMARATSNYAYGTSEYVTIAKGMSPNRKLAITAHGEGEFGYDNFHIYLTDAVTGKRVGPLEEIVGTLDTGADAFCAQWSADSKSVAIIYRIDRHEPLKVVSYRFGHGRAFLIKGPVDATEEQTQYWGEQCSISQPSEKTFGTSQGQ